MINAMSTGRTIEGWLRLLAPWLGVIAVFLPALTLMAPMMTQQTWTPERLVHASLLTAFQHGSAHTQPSLAHTLHRIVRIRRELSTHTGQGGHVPAAFVLALLIPAAVMLSAAFSFAVLLLELFRKFRLVTAFAIGGTVCSAYAILASWWLTRVVHQEIAQVVQQAQSHFSFHGLAQLASSMSEDMALRPEIALFLMLFGFLAMLILPQPPATTGA